ncbi:MAG: hypothetical protein JNM93_06640 [Bacteriovoracaceae bacterium]|nr:hypothetical protein [Bacteriovoracaceae bacterium]
MAVRMLGKAKDFVRDNPVVSTGIGIALLMMLLDFGDQGQTIYEKAKKKAAKRNPASKEYQKLLGDESTTSSGENSVQTYTQLESPPERLEMIQSGSENQEDFRGMSFVGDSGGSGDTTPSLALSDGQDNTNTREPDKYVPIEDDITPVAGGGFAGGGGCFGENCVGNPPPSSGGPIGGGSGSTTISVVGSPGSGSYVTNPTVTLTGANTTQILYCLSLTSTCCEPSSTYTSPVLISSGAAGVYTGGSYCLSFKGVNGTNSSSVVQQQYLVDNTLPALTAGLFPVSTMYQIQSTETQYFLRSNSSDFGASGFTFFNIALKNNNPASYTDCEDIVNSFPSSTYGMRSPAGALEINTDGLTPASNIDMRISMNNGVDHYGINYMVSVMQFTDLQGESVYMCMPHQVLLRDFTVFTPTNVSNFITAPDFTSGTYGINEFQGMIQPFGPFGGGNSGPGVASGPNFDLEYNLVNIIN